MFAFAKDLGSVGGSTVSTVFSIGLTQDDAIRLLGEDEGLTTYPSLWKSYFGSGLDAVGAFSYSLFYSFSFFFSFVPFFFFFSFLFTFLFTASEEQSIDHSLTVSLR